MRSKEKVKRRK